MRTFRAEKRQSAVIGGAFVALLAVLSVATFLLAATPLNAQRVTEAYKLNLAEPSQKAPSGAWGTERHDRDAKALLEERLIHAGIVRVLGTPGHSMEHNAHKLRASGVLEQDGGLYLGADWDYHHPIREALRDITMLLPEDSTRMERWPWPDQALYELGRQAVPYIEARRDIESLLTQISFEALAHAFVLRVLNNVPADIPMVLPSDGKLDPLERLKPLLLHKGAHTVLMLGPTVASIIQQIKNADDNPERERWADSLLAGLDIINSELAAALLGREKIGERPALRALQVGLPQNLERSETWPQADQIFLRVGGLGAINTLEIVRATNRAFASKANWLIGQIRRRYAAKLVDDLLLMAKRGELKEGYMAIGEPELNPAVPVLKDPAGTPLVDHLAGISALDALLTMLVAAPDLKDAVGHERDRALTLRLGGQPDGVEEADRIDLMAKVITDGFVTYTDRFNARKIGRIYTAFRDEPQRFKELESELRIESAALGVTGFGELERLRQEASHWEAKLNWFQDLIIERDRLAGRRKFVEAAVVHAKQFGVDLTRSELEELGQFGRIEVNKDWALMHGNDFDLLLQKQMFKSDQDGTYYYGNQDFERLRTLSRRDFQTLLSTGSLSPAVGVTFYGEEDNDGRRYDYQNDVGTKGLSIDLLEPKNNTRRTFDLVPGRTYVFSFEYFTKNLSGQKTWVNFLPLDADGRAIGPDGRPLSEAFSWGEGTDAEVGKFIAFPFASESTKGQMVSGSFTGDSGGAWLSAGFRLVSVPDPVHGFTVEIKLNSLTGQGSFGYRNFRLELVEDYFRDGFEAPASSATSAGTPPVTSVDPLENGTWHRIDDPANNFSPWSQVSYNTMTRFAGDRSLQIDPKGFNVRLETDEYFELNSNRSYIFRGMLNTRRMEDMNAWFEILLYDRDRNPVTIDGLATEHGNNVFRSPKRSDVSTQLLWGSLRTADGWFREEIVLDDLRPIDLEASSELKSIDQRKRHEIRYARVAIVVAGKHPSYSAQVLVDEIELRENPRVEVNLYQQEKVATAALPGSMESHEVGNPILIGRNFAEPEPLSSGRPYRLLIGLEVTGLVPNRLGYHYTLDLYDYLGRRVKAADTIGAKALDKVVNSNRFGTIGVNEFGFIDLDRLDVANRFGYFSAHFRLNFKDESVPIIERVFKIGFMPERLNKKRKVPGDLGVVLDQNSSKQRWLDRALRHLDAGRLAFPVMTQEMEPNGGDYKDEQFLEDSYYLMRLLPNVRRTAMLGPLPLGFADIHAEGNADGVFSDARRDEWKELLKKVQGRWQDRFDDYIVGDVADDSFNQFTSHASQALDNLEGEFSKNLVQWAPRVLPVRLKSGAEERQSVESFVKAFERRWTQALTDLDATRKTAISNVLTPDDERKVRESSPSLAWLKEGERFSFYVPAELSVADMSQGVADYLGRIGKYEDVIGTTDAAALANAQTLSQGGQVDFAGMLDERANADMHTIVIDILQVPKERFSEQLADLIQKIARARALGFKRIFVSRLRNTGSDDLPDGLMSRGNLAQPAFYAFRTLNAVLSGRVVDPVALNMKNKNDYLFFRDPDNNSLTFMLFPSNEDIIEDLPFGNDVQQIDIMGNSSELPSLLGSDGTPSGMVRLRVRANGLPLIVTGIDNTLLDVVQSLKLDNPTLTASETDQRRELTLTNSFDTRVSVNVSLPLEATAQADRNISWDARIKTLTGVEAGGIATTFDFESRDLAPGETVTFPFILKPRRSMGTGERYLPVRVLVKGRKVYEFTQRIKIDVSSQLSVTETTALDPGEGRGLDVIFRVQTSLGQAQALSATVTLPEHADTVRARVRDFSLTPNGSTEVSVTLPVIPKSKQEGLKISLNVRQKGGNDFLNAVYRLTVDTDTGGLLLVLDDDYVKP